MFNMGKDGLILIGIVILALVIFAPTMIPKLTKSFGQTMKGLREGLGEDEVAKKEPGEPEPASTPKETPKEVTAADPPAAPVAAKVADKPVSKDQEAI
jgi:sec-independent protein translocase protein TatA